MLVEELRGRFAFLAASAWPALDKVDLVILEVGDGSPRGPRVPVSTVSLVNPNKMWSMYAYVVPKSIPMTMKSSRSEFLLFLSLVTRLFSNDREASPLLRLASVFLENRFIVTVRRV